jgi:hypothetical protein
VSDEQAAKIIADKIRGTPNLNIQNIKMYVTKYLGMVGKAPTDVDFITAHVNDILSAQGMSEGEESTNYEDNNAYNYEPGDGHDEDAEMPTKQFMNLKQFINKGPIQVKKPSKELPYTHNYIRDLAKQDSREEHKEENEEKRLDPKCWKGYHKQGTKLKGGKRVNNCVKNREENEERRLDPKCWKGYHKQGTKLKGGKRVNNCVKNK